MTFTKLETRHRLDAISPHAREGVSVGLKLHRGTPNSPRPEIDLKINVDIMNAMHLLVGDRVELYFNAETRQLAIERAVNGPVILRPYRYGIGIEPGTVAATMIRVSSIPGLTNTAVPTAHCPHHISADHPARLVINLPAQFFARADNAGVTARIRAA